MRSLRPFLVFALAVVLAGAAQGQVASALVTEGAPLPGNPDYVASSLSIPAVNGPLGWVFNLIATFGGATVGLAYGTYDGVAVPDVLQIEHTSGNYQQDSWESFFGISADGVAYSPLCTRLSDGVTGLDSVWYEDTVVAIEQEPYPHLAGWFWSFGSRPDVTLDGVPYFVGGITDVQGGSTDNRGLFYGFDTQPLILGGMMIGGLANPVVNGSEAVSFDYRFSAYGTHYLAETATATGSTNNDNSMVSDGAVVLIDGQPVTEASPVPAAAGGLPGENWDNFDNCGITEDGHWFLTGDTDAATAVDEFVLVDGAIVLREGDLIDGFPINGAIESGAMNEDGDWAVVWDVDSEGTNVEVLILNGQIVLMEGMPVDIDGDLVPDLETAVLDFTGIASVAVADRDAQGRARVYFTADVDVPAGGALRLGEPIMASDEDGYDEAVPGDPDGRVAIEYGLVLVPEGTVPVYLAEFTAEDRGFQIELSWRVNGAAAAGDFAVRAEQGGAVRDLVVVSDGPAGFHCVDRPAAGEVTYRLLHREGDGWSELASKTLTPDLPAGAALVGARPNPFNPRTEIVLALGRDQQVRLSVHDAAGRLVAVVHDGPLAAGEHALAWSGERVPSGVYVARMVADDGQAQTKLLLVK